MPTVKLLLEAEDLGHEDIEFKVHCLKRGDAKLFVHRDSPCLQHEVPVEPVPVQNPDPEPFEYMKATRTEILAYYADNPNVNLNANMSIGKLKRAVAEQLRVAAVG